MRKYTIKCILVCSTILFRLEAEPQAILMVSPDADKEEGRTARPYDTTASSFLVEAGMPQDAHNPYKVYGGNMNDAWCEGVQGSGIGEWVKFEFRDIPDRALMPEDSVACQKNVNELHRIAIVNGFAGYPANRALYTANNRVKKMRMELSTGESMILDFRDNELDYQKFRLNRQQAAWIKLTILEVYRGSRFDDTCISDIRIEEDNYGYFRPEGAYKVFHNEGNCPQARQSTFGFLGCK